MPRSLAVALALVVALGACGEAEEPAVVPPPAPSPGATTGAVVPPTEPTASDETPSRGVIELTVRDGEVSGAGGRVPVPLGTEVTLSVTSDVADVIHVHGYDLHQDVPAGGSAELTFTADIPGVFEVELEGSGVRLVELEIS